MKRFIRATITISEDAAHALDRLRRGTREPFARFAGRVLTDALSNDARRSSRHAARSLRRTA
jgi:hypothetical protein